MCNSVFLSTDSPEDLAAGGGDLLGFTPASDAEMAIVRAVLRHPYIWHVSGHGGGCSCHFRHAPDPDLGFGPPEAWMPEDASDVESTQAFYDVTATLIESGHAVDLVDLWNLEAGELASKVVSLSTVGREDFRFWEGYRFELVA